ncbi:MAG: DUF2461 domain-containing protein [Clostridia bacterium]|nr:DUF2461 domain-containing protein [Clostridia bacterium]
MTKKTNNLSNVFTPKTVEFLAELKINNSKAWFEENRETYNQYVLGPMQNLVMSLSGFMLSIDPCIETTPSVGKTISRIHRDIRFSNDKSPYRSNVWITFKRPSREWQDAPAFFFDLSPSSYSYGMGFYAADKKTMEKFRAIIESRHDEFRNAVSVFSKQDIFAVGGEKYKRILNKDIPQDLLDWYQRKDLYFICSKNISENLFSSSLAKDLITDLSLLADFYSYLYKIKDTKL